MNRRTEKVLSFIKKTINQDLGKLAKKKGVTRKGSWDVNLYIPEEIAKFLLCKYDHTFQFVLMGEVKQEVLAEIFDDLQAVLTVEDQLESLLLSSKSDIDFEITCPSYKQGKGGRIYLVEDVKKGLFHKRKVHAVVE